MRSACAPTANGSNPRSSVTPAKDRQTPARHILSRLPIADRDKRRCAGLPRHCRSRRSARAAQEGGSMMCLLRDPLIERQIRVGQPTSRPDSDTPRFLAWTTRVGDDLVPARQFEPRLMGGPPLRTLASPERQNAKNAYRPERGRSSKFTLIASSLGTRGGVTNHPPQPSDLSTTRATVVARCRQAAAFGMQSAAVRNRFGPTGRNSSSNSSRIALRLPMASYSQLSPNRFAVF